MRLFMRQVVILSLLCGSGIVFVGQPAEAQTGLVGHWAMEDPAGSTAAVDSSGSGNTATCSGSACPTFGVAGQIGTAASFDGSDDVLRVNNTVTNSFTISAWIKTTSVGANTAGGQGYGGNGIIYSDVPGSGTGDMIPMALVSDRIGFDTGTASNCTAGDDTLTSTVAVNTGQWVHVAVTRDMTTGVKQIYINGTLNATNNNGGTCALSGNSSIYFGGNTVDVRYFNGQIDDVYFFDRVLSANEIQSLKGAIITTPPVVSSLCGPNNPAAISGSTGEQGVLDPANTNASLGLVWPSGASGAGIFLDTGEVIFIDSTGTLLSTSGVLPGVSSFPAFPDGKLNFTSIHLPPGKWVLTGASFSDPPPSLVIAPALILSCQDVILEGNGDGTLANNGVLFPSAGTFLGGGHGALFPNPAGFGPRSSSRPATGSLYPALAGGGGNAGTGIPVGQSLTQTLTGGNGGGAAVIAAAGRITVNGMVSANPNILWTLPNFLFGERPPLNARAASSSSTVAQGGAGGSVRLAALLVEGIGKIDTSAGADSDGVVRSTAGPIEIQAFLQDLFTGATSTTPTRGNPVAAPVPENLPGIAVDRVYTVLQPFPCPQSGCANTGSLTTPDIILSAASGPVTVTVDVFTHGVPLTTSLTIRAVGTNGSAVTATTSVGACDCLAGEGFASGILTLDPGATYQIIVYPDTAFALARLHSPPSPLSSPTLYAGWQPGFSHETKPPLNPSETRVRSPLEKWARAFGVDPEAHQKMAQLKTAP